MLESVGKFEPNIITGLTLPVLRKRIVDDVEEFFINMEFVASHYVVECGEITPEMSKWIEDNWLLQEGE